MRKYFKIEVIVSSETHCYFTFAENEITALEGCLMYLKKHRKGLIEKAAEYGFLNFDIKEQK